MSVHQEDNGTYTVRISLPRQVDGRRPQYVRKGFKLRREANEHDREKKMAKDRRADLVAGRMAFGTYLTDRWLPTIDMNPRLSAGTKAHYRRMTKHLVQSVGHIALDRLDGDHLTMLYGQMRAKGYAEATVRHVHVTAHRALHDARRMVPHNAADDAITPAQPRGNPRSYTPDQIATFMRVASENRWAPFWRLACTTGKRRGELAGMRWEDLDLDHGDWTVGRSATVVDHAVVEGSTKSGRVTRVALDPQTVAALRAWRKQQTAERLACGGDWQGADRVWTWQDGKPLHPDTVTRTWKRLRDAAELPALRFHHLRHSWATNALNSGADVKYVSARLDHSSTRITHDLYVEATAEQDRMLADRMANLYDGLG
jgi:integrase